MEILLRRAKEWVRDHINKQVKKGKGLIVATHHVKTEASLNSLSGRYSNWTEFNRTLLQTSFEGPILEEYDSPGGVWLVKSSLDQRINELRERIVDKNRKLTSIEQRLDLFDPLDADGILVLDPDLWLHVKASVIAGDWLQAASLAATFVESKIREWSNLGPDKYGKDLMSTALRPNAASPLELGNTPGEQEGWHLLAMGFVSALGNVDRHRIQDRDDLRRYGLGVLYTASLLLTQIKHQYPDLAQ